MSETFKSPNRILEDLYFDKLEDNEVQFLYYEDSEPFGSVSPVLKDEFIGVSLDEMARYIGYQNYRDFLENGYPFTQATPFDLPKKQNYFSGV